MSLRRRLKKLDSLIRTKTGNNKPVVYGVVNKVDADGTEHYVRKWEGTIGNMTPSDKEPTIKIAEKLEPFILIHRKYKCALVDEVEQNPLWPLMLR